MLTIRTTVNHIFAASDAAGNAAEEKWYYEKNSKKSNNGHNHPCQQSNFVFGVCGNSFVTVGTIARPRMLSESDHIMR